ncbi:MAG: inovirus Gp2 family protein [Rheinheimera sp.]|nr:MAG: inovirus Gp2 family protein [Rheinheimera sp.]
MAQFNQTPFQQLLKPVNGLWHYWQFQGLPVNLNYGPLIYDYLDGIHQTIISSLLHSPRTFAFRVDLRLPANFSVQDTAVISRFFASLKAQLDAADAKKEREGKRVHSHNLRYVWVREIGEYGRPHYHVLVLLNKDRYRTLGSFDAEEGNLSARVTKAWASAVGLPLAQADGLVHFPPKPTYTLDPSDPGFTDVLKSLFFRVSYFAKEPTKFFDRAQRSYGASRL